MFIHPRSFQSMATAHAKACPTFV